MRKETLDLPCYEIGRNLWEPIASDNNDLLFDNTIGEFAFLKDHVVKNGVKMVLIRPALRLLNGRKHLRC